MQRQFYRSLSRLIRAAEHTKGSPLLPLLQSNIESAPLLLHQLANIHAGPSSSTPRNYSGSNCSSVPRARSFASQGRPSGIPAGAFQNPIAASRSATIRVTLVSSNLLAEPYKGEPPALPVSAWFTISGWKERWRRWMGGVKSIYSIAKLRRNVTGWSLPSFKQEALNIYEQACSALAQGDRTALRQLVTPIIFTDMKRQIKTREEGGWKRIEWAMVTKPTLKQIEVVQGRLIAIDPKDDNTGFVQLTVRFKSSQKFVAYDGKGHVVAGSEDGTVQVDDFWVFERPLKEQSSNRWRVAGRLQVPQQGFLPR